MTQWRIQDFPKIAPFSPFPLLFLLFSSSSSFFLHLAAQGGGLNRRTNPPRSAPDYRDAEAVGNGKVFLSSAKAGSQQILVIILQMFKICWVSRNKRDSRWGGGGGGGSLTGKWNIFSGQHRVIVILIGSYI